MKEKLEAMIQKAIDKYGPIIRGEIKKGADQTVEGWAKKALAVGGGALFVYLVLCPNGKGSHLLPTPVPSASTAGLTLNSCTIPIEINTYYFTSDMARKVGE